MNEVAQSSSCDVSQTQNSGGMNSDATVHHELPKMTSSVSKSKLESTAGIVLFILGIVQIILGSVSIIAHSLSFLGYTVYNIYMSGIWCGVVYIICGVLGVIFAKEKEKGKSLLAILAIIAAIFSIVAITFAALEIRCASTTGCGFSCAGRCNKALALAMSSIVMIASLAEFVISILCCSLCGYLLCCAPQQNLRLQVVHGMPQVHTNYQMGNVTYSNQGQSIVTHPFSSQMMQAQHMMAAQQQPVMPKQVEQQMVSRQVEQQMRPQHVEQQMMPQMAERQMMPHQDEQQMMPQMVERQMMPQQVEQRMMPQEVERQMMPQQVEQQIPATQQKLVHHAVMV